MSVTSATLLIAHGSRRPEANADLVRLAEMLAPHLPGERIEIAYLELAEPTIPEGLSRCLAAGATRVRMMPYFLSAGAHVTGDLERFRADFAARYPDVAFQLCGPLGLHPRIIDIVLDRLDEAAVRQER
jgi:sirohydrochlorin ferrochelatase